MNFPFKFVFYGLLEVFVWKAHEQNIQAHYSPGMGWYQLPYNIVDFGLIVLLFAIPTAYLLFPDEIKEEVKA